ncbi:MAG: MBL fold metallo-hydrolase [Patescibacteria group bacterium]
MNTLKEYSRIIFVSLLLLSNIFIWYVYLCERNSGEVTVSFLNIGQGDAIYIQSPTGNQIMIDGGPPHAVLGELRKVIPFYDRSLDMLLVTNPDTDHYAGFIDVLKGYDVKYVAEPGTYSPSQTYKVFKEEVAHEHASTTLLKRNMIIHLGGGADLHILYPDKDVSKETTNDGSVLAKLVYKNNEIMFTGDAPKSSEEYLVSLNPHDLKSDVLKVGHHGSKTSSSEKFVEAINPRFAIISAGEKNRYGHPHSETTDVFKKLGVPVFGTYEHGMITLKLDGINVATSFEK